MDPQYVTIRIMYIYLLLQLWSPQYNRAAERFMSRVSVITRAGWLTPVFNMRPWTLCVWAAHAESQRDFSHICCGYWQWQSGFYSWLFVEQIKAKNKMCLAHLVMWPHARWGTSALFWAVIHWLPHFSSVSAELSGVFAGDFSLSRNEPSLQSVVINSMTGGWNWSRGLKL